MDAQEFMTNEGVIETTEELVTKSSGKGFKVAAGIGLTIIIGGIVYKFVAKPIIAKIKSSRNQSPIYPVGGNYPDRDEVVADEVEESNN